MRLKIVFALSLAILAAGCTAKTLPSQEPRAVSPLQFAANEWRVPRQVVVVTDSSGTMYQNQTFPYAKALTQSFVKAMPEANTRAKFPGGYDASLIGFGGEERIVSALAPFDRGALGSTANSLRILGDIHGYGGTTPFHEVFAEVQNALVAKSGVAALVIFSDGIPQDESAAMGAAKWVVDSYAGDVCIHTVWVGDDADGARFLAALAALTSCGSTRALADVWGPENFMAFTHDVFAGEAPPEEPDACAGRIVLRGIEFAFDRAELTGSSFVILDVAIEELSRCPNIPVRIEGHTDALGSDEYNQALGQRRADSVRSYFVSKGLSGSRLSARSFGESNPVASNETDEGRQLNRRVELHPEQ
jgi:OOP family OmpA-OmpF porin